MATAFAHAFAAASLGAVVLPRPRAAFVTAGVICSLLPDVDVLGFGLGISYRDLLGHRGLTHSVAFAALVAALMTAALTYSGARAELRLRVAVYFFIVTASHGLFDAMTNGGLGVAFLAPFDSTRWFLPWRPIIVSPIGVAEFFTQRAVAILASEFVWIVLPWTALCALVWVLVRGRDAGRIC